MVQGDRAAALEYFERFERQTASSRLFGEIMLAKADLLASENRLEEAAQTINTMLDSPSVSSREKAQALVSMGDLMMKQQKFSIALPYFQRVYVMYGRWRPLVARAYLRSGEAFEALDDKSAAIQTYREMLDQGDLATTPEGKTARERLETLISQSRPEVGTA
jgi:tetratricopeptide (TPR) repeat protein